MAWDIMKHKTISSKFIEVSPTTNIVVERFSYDGGPEKIRLGRMITKRSGETAHTPISGIDLKDIEKVAQAMLDLSK